MFFRKLYSRLDHIQGALAKMNTELENLAAQVAKNVTVEESAVLLINGLAQQLKAAGTDPGKLADLQKSLETGAGDLSAAIAANTMPAPPVVDPVPSPAPPSPAPATS